MEEKAVQSAINAFSREEAMEGLGKDVQIYIEGCITYRKLHGKIVMLVTDYHKFFAKSTNILMTQIQTVVRVVRYIYVQVS